MSLTRKDRPRVVVISSLVSGSRVGGGLGAAVLETRGIRADLVPTVVMGRHPGQGAPGGGDVSADMIATTLAAMEDQGVIDEADAILTGYFRTPEQVEAAAGFIERARAKRRDLIVMVDPIIGDASPAGPGRLYVPEAAARAQRERLVPLADIITPNRFELAWLTGHPHADPYDDMVVECARKLAPAAIVTSTSAAPGEVGFIVVNATGAWAGALPRVPDAPNGTGDLFAAWALAERLKGGRDWREAAAIAATATFDLLDLARRLGLPELPAPPIQPLPMTTRPHMRRVGASRPVTALGVDGAKGGWAAIEIDLNGLALPRARFFTHFEDVLDTEAQIIAVDMPIGFESRPAAPGGRACERLARARLGERRSSVFSAPLRETLRAQSYEEALEINRAEGGPGISKQCWHLFPKLREVDALMGPGLEGAVFEVHPELVFTAIAGRPAAHPKRLAEGREERLNLLEAERLPRAIFEPHPFKRALCAPDDLIDAGLGALAARRIAEGVNIQLPEDPPRDARGLRMAIFA
ncbi:MAG: PfkB family carbohydrate kinase [Oceanicaulis sp.]